MKKSSSRLSLRTETVRILDASALAAVGGGLIIRPRPTISCPQPSSPSHNSECNVEN